MTPQNGPATLKSPGAIPEHVEARTRVTRRKQARAIDTRARVLSGAANVFDTVGYAASTIADVVEAGGVTKGALFHHFSSKEAIAYDLVRVWADTVDTAFTVSAGTRESAAVQLRIAFRALANRVSTDVASRTGLKLSIESGIGGACETYRHFVTRTAALVEECIELGVLPDTARSRRAAFNVCAGFTAAVMCGRLDLDSDVPTVDLDARVRDVLTAYIGI